ncbi:hypothetical protein NQ318_006691 [Aromia moschata]|uniref:Mos1 transposase HTH domain-containing protein n=1 Tax=Aromia moschata TaxID=1265417 RepID=A0AAV8YQA7_9CUCU|nr:hypothetical protein NQ318_006691 [Aromia moschata]
MESQEVNSYMRTTRCKSVTTDAGKLLQPSSPPYEVKSHAAVQLQFTWKYHSGRGYNFMMNKNIRQSVAIKFSFKAGKCETETFEMLTLAYVGSVMSRASVFRWYNLYAEGRESVEDDERSGRSCVTKSNENIAKVTEFVLQDTTVNASFYL